MLYLSQFQSPPVGGISYGRLHSPLDFRQNKLVDFLNENYGKFKNDDRGQGKVRLTVM